ncbi:hypothetical protein I862_02815 [endosymbiont of Acanthamoeba sp. UWC8]|uniref:hypothetical protein n=1 Tax=endosymbiont of Acanthamoeba sp. UWC8 TaxID=86106 RepID=UPI0004D0EF02|nr:hypothetical protein [endosymbiont of Acanthamoeba sp. UWC8]AIF81126.1 hypothetical protein I862_02815 [endosymbiont of Acanthamoeba sp. UWC8]
MKENTKTAAKILTRKKDQNLISWREQRKLILLQENIDELKTDLNILTGKINILYNSGMLEDEIYNPLLKNITDNINKLNTLEAKATQEIKTKKMSGHTIDIGQLKIQLEQHSKTTEKIGENIEKLIFKRRKIVNQIRNINSVKSSLEKNLNEIKQSINSTPQESRIEHNLQGKIVKKETEKTKLMSDKKQIEGVISNILLKEIPNLSIDLNNLTDNLPSKELGLQTVIDKLIDKITGIISNIKEYLKPSSEAKNIQKPTEIMNEEVKLTKPVIKLYKEKEPEIQENKNVLPKKQVKWADKEEQRNNSPLPEGRKL